MAETTDIRPLQEADWQEWQRLWRDYLTFYETSVEDAVYRSTFERLLSDGPYEPTGLLATIDDRPVGLVHYMFHRHCWKIENVCYLQDLYADAAVRGKGVGRTLIEAVYACADAAGCPSVYWMTQDFNATARTLYDRIGTLTPFIKYQR